MVLVILRRHRMWTAVSRPLRFPALQASFLSPYSRRGAGGTAPRHPSKDGQSSMRATVERSHLLKSLGHVHRVVERRNTIPILSNVLVTRRRRQADAEGDRPRPRGDRDGAGRGRPGRRDHGAGPYPLRHRAQAPRRRRGLARHRRRLAARGQVRALALRAPGAARGRLPRPHHRRFPDPLPPAGERRSRS